jgi:hypothetical protein
MAFGLIKFPKNDRHFMWTDHSKSKMIQYFISESKIRSIIKKHNRLESGIAPKTIAVMQRNDKGKKKEELWVMYQKTGDKKTGERLKIISVWRYPGVSPKKEVPIPEDVVEELRGMNS